MTIGHTNPASIRILAPLWGVSYRDDSLIFGVVALWGWVFRRSGVDASSPKYLGHKSIQGSSTPCTYSKIAIPMVFFISYKSPKQYRWYIQSKFDFSSFLQTEILGQVKRLGRSFRSYHEPFTSH